ncbi:MAG: hypothetical protein EBU98_07590, partial [Actinobacteria bacterium]|nr:hypothetical protein [Actinomycetota bacterium]
MTASGTAGYSDELAAYVDLSSLGAVVVKSLAPFAWPGNASPRVHALVEGAWLRGRRGHRPANRPLRAGRDAARGRRHP